MSAEASADTEIEVGKLSQEKIKMMMKVRRAYHPDARRDNCIHAKSAMQSSSHAMNNEGHI